MDVIFGDDDFWYVVDSKGKIVSPPFLFKAAALRWIDDASRD